MDQSVTEAEPAPVVADMDAHRAAPPAFALDRVIAPDDAGPAGAIGESAAISESEAAPVAAADSDQAVAAPVGASEPVGLAETAAAEAGDPQASGADMPATDLQAADLQATSVPAADGAAAGPDAPSAGAAKPAPAKAAAPKPAARSRPEAANDAAPVAEAPSLPVPDRASPPMRHGDSRGSHMMNGRPPAISRASLLDETFSEGDHVVYPTHGVGRVEKIAVEEIAGQKLELIQITFEENRMTLRVPVTKARSAGLRRLATRKLFDEALALLKGRARVKKTMWSRRAQEYEAKINSGDPLQIAEVVRDLHRNSGQPDQSFSERQIYEAALDRLAAELAALDETDKATASTKLTNFLKTIA